MPTDIIATGSASSATVAAIKAQTDKITDLRVCTGVVTNAFISPLSFSVTLTPDLSTDDVRGLTLRFTSGALDGFVRPISFMAAGPPTQFFFDSPWLAPPAAGDTFEILLLWGDAPSPTPDNYTGGGTVAGAIGNFQDGTTDPSAATGSVFSKLRGMVAAVAAALAASFASIKAKTDLIPASPATEGNVSAVGALALAAWRVSPNPVTPIAIATLGNGEQTLLDVGADAGAAAYRLDGAVANLTALGGNVTVLYRVYAEVNGALVLIATLPGVVAAGRTNIAAATGVSPLASRHLRVTVQGDSVLNNGAVSATFATSKAGA